MAMTNSLAQEGEGRLSLILYVPACLHSLWAKGGPSKPAALRTHRLVPCSDRALSRFAIVIFQQSTQSLPTAYRAFFRTHSLSVSRK